VCVCVCVVVCVCVFVCVCVCVCVCILLNCPSFSKIFQVIPGLPQVELCVL